MSSSRLVGTACRTRNRSGFTLMELLVAIFIMAIAIAGSIALIYAGARQARRARQKCMAAILAQMAIADALETAEALRRDNSGKVVFPAPTSPLPSGDRWVLATDDDLGPPGYERRRHPRKLVLNASKAEVEMEDMTYGWQWRAHSFDPATGLFDLDVWVFRHPTEPDVLWGASTDLTAVKRATLFYLRSRIGDRAP